MLQERNQTSRDPNHLARSNVHVLDQVRSANLEVSTVTCNQVRTRYQFTIFGFGIRWSDVSISLLVCTQPLNFLGQLTTAHNSIWRNQKAILIDSGINCQRADQTDVRTFRRFNRADTTIVRNVNVANFEARAFTVQTTRSQCGQSSLVSQLRQWVCLVNHLRKFTTTKEVFDRCGDTFRVHQATRSHIFRIFQAHAFLNGAAQLQEALAQFFAGQLINRAQTTITEVVDIVILSFTFRIRQIDQVID
jgi:hypothetical protein